MEIREYLKAKRRWLPALVAVPLLAAAATVGYVSLQPPETTVEVRGYVPPALTSSDSQIGLYIARLNEGLGLDRVRTDIARTAQIDETQLVQVSVDRTGQSDQFTLTTVTTVPPERAIAVGESAAKVGTGFVARQALQGADGTTKLARDNFDKAQTELFAYQDEIGDLDPNVTYANVSRQLLDPAPTTNVADLQAQQKKLVAEVRRYNELKAVTQTTSGILGGAQAQSNSHSGEIIAAEAGDQILFSDVVQDPIPGMRFLEPAGLTLVLTLIAVLGLSLLPDLLRRTPAGPATVSRGSANPPEPPTPALGQRRTFAEPQLTPPQPGAPSDNGTPVASGSGSTAGARD